MKRMILLIIAITFIGCSENINNRNTVSANELKSVEMQNYPFLKEMYQDDYFPNFLVDKLKILLVELCADLEKEENSTKENQLKLIRKFIAKTNDMQNEFDENGSEIETGARESILGDVEFIMETYKVKCDFDEATADRDW